MEELQPTEPGQRPSLLLVDDEESILNSLRRLLRSQPYEVLLADSGARALEILAQRPVDLVMSDARMPDMDGATLSTINGNVSASGPYIQAYANGAAIFGELTHNTSN